MSKKKEVIGNVNISGCNYEVISKNEIRAPETGDRAVGLIHYEKQKIYIQENMHADMKNTTLLHEILHGIFSDRNITLEEDEEFIIDNIANGMYQVIKENPHIFNMSFQ